MTNYYHELQELYIRWVNVETQKYAPLFAPNLEETLADFRRIVAEFADRHAMSSATVYNILAGLAKERKPFWWKEK